MSRSRRRETKDVRNVKEYHTTRKEGTHRRVGNVPRMICVGSAESRTRGRSGSRRDVTEDPLEKSTTNNRAVREGSLLG